MATTTPTALRDLDACHHLHPFTNHKSLRADGSRVIVKGEGCYLWDEDGNRILDGMAGLWNVNIGYGRRELADAAHRQMSELPFYNTFFKTTHPPVVQLSQRLARLAPDGFNQVFYGSSGSESVDTAIRLLRHYWALRGEPARQIIISRRAAYHGSTIAAASMGGIKTMHEQSYPVYPGFRHVIPPYWFGEAEAGESPADFGLRAARAIEEEILAVGPENVAAVAAEPIMGAGGVKIPPPSYWPEVQRIVDKYGVLLLADEVITAFGRLGNWFAAQHYGIRPHLITFAKAVTSGYIPLSGVLVHDRIATELAAHDDDFHHGYTYSGHPVACAVAIANLDIIDSEGLIERVATQTGPALAEMLQSFADHPLVGEVRSRGLLAAIELVADKSSRRRFAGEGRVGLVCREHAFREGLIMRAVGDTMVLSPPLIWTQSQLHEAREKIRRVLDLTLADVAAEVSS